ncbi:MAG: NAD-dependent epimerase/dehydratase family protein, partial [Pirellulaceae bacterium]
MIALVTGGGGFLGRYIVEMLLARGTVVRVIARGSYPELEAKGVQMFRGDLSETDQLPAACAGAEVVFHVAALAGIWGKWEWYQRSNVLGTERVIEACQAAGVPRLLKRVDRHALLV